MADRVEFEDERGLFLRVFLVCAIAWMCAAAQVFDASIYRAIFCLCFGMIVPLAFLVIMPFRKGAEVLIRIAGILYVGLLEILYLSMGFGMIEWLGQE